MLVCISYIKSDAQPVPHGYQVHNDKYDIATSYVFDEAHWNLINASDGII